MTEAEWLACPDPELMMVALRGKASDRKLRLFAVACCRKHLQCMIQSNCRKAVEVAELFADGLATEQERAVAHANVDPIWGESTAFAAWASASPPQAEAICEVQRQKWVNHRALFLEIFGTLPFRPVITVSSWLSAPVIGLAETIYQGRSFDGLPILADALEEAGCTDADILNHCRQPGEHVRGCWVIDLLTGRK